MKWLRKIFGLCQHHYEHVALHNARTHLVYVSRCKHCGKLSTKTIC